jgi:serine/threonine-protein kinase
VRADEAARLVAMARRRVGETLDDEWRLDALLGVGATAAVYAASRNGRRAAIKLLHQDYARNDEARARLSREMMVVWKIDHPGAICIHGQGESEDGTMYLVMELLDGEPLDGVVRRRGRLLPREALSVAFWVLDVLVKAHAKGIIHRDIKPENIFVLRDGRIKLLDFGVAGVRQTSHSSELTGVHSLLGTPGFMPSELAVPLHDEVDARTDLWALGATVFLLLTGRLVHGNGLTPDELLNDAATKPAPKLRTVLPDASPDIARWVDRALAFKSKNRWPTAKAMLSALRPILEPPKRTSFALLEKWWLRWVPPSRATSSGSQPGSPLWR